MADIIDFNKRKNNHSNMVSDEMFSMSVYMDQDGMYEVYMEVNDAYDEEQIGDALTNAMMKYLIDHDQVEEVDLKDWNAEDDAN